MRMVQFALCCECVHVRAEAIETAIVDADACETLLLAFFRPTV